MGIDMVSSLESFQRDWSRHYSNALPMAHLLRGDDRLPWVRFHALPESKRYAEGEAERLEILRRANVLGSEVLGPAAECWLVECRAEEYPKPYLGLPHGPVLRYPDPEDGFVWIAMAKQVSWLNGGFDILLGEVAEDTTGPTLWMNRSNGVIFAPYDGGFDIFPMSLDEVERLKQRYVDWLSPYPGGL